VAAIRATCECTGFDPAEYVGRTIAPGEAMPLILRLRIGTRLGSHQSEIELMTARGTVYWFYIHYDAFATYTCVPEEVNFKDIALDDYDDSSDLVRSVSPHMADPPCGLIRDMHSSELARQRA